MSAPTATSHASAGEALGLEIARFLLAAARDQIRADRDRDQAAPQQPPVRRGGEVT